MKLQSFMMSDTLYLVLHIPIVDTSLQFNLYGIHNISLVHPILKMSFKYSMLEEYLTIRSDSQHILFQLSSDIISCQMSNGQFYHINSPLYTVDTSNSFSYVLFLKNKERIYKFCILSVINRTQDEPLNINHNFGQCPTFKIIKSCT